MIGLAVLYVAAEKYGITKHVASAVRAGAYAFVAATAVGAFSIHKAHAALGEKGLTLGEDLASLSSVLQDANTITINGQRIHLATGVTTKGRAEILDDFVASCKKNAPPDTQVWNTLPDPEDPNPKAIESMPIYREEKGNRGLALCIAPTASTPKRSFQDALNAFFETGEMSELGRFRYVYVTEGKTGSAVVSAYTDEKFNISALAPENDDGTADRTGSDPQVMLRPADGVRLLSASVEGLPYRAYAYHTHTSVQATMEAYDAQMHAAGWVSVEHPMFAAAPHEGEIRGYLKNGTVGFATATTDEKGITMLAIGESGGLDHAKPQQPKDSDGF